MQGTGTTTGITMTTSGSPHREGESDDNGDAEEEPPKKKAKKDHTYCDKGGKGE